MACYPLRRIKAALSRVENGDLSVRISPTWSDEFQQMYNQFNQMAEKLEQLIEQEYKLKLLHADAELRQLRYQINPHFLYNTYFNLRAMLFDEEYDIAAQLADLMGRYLRYITASAGDEATLKEEMEHAVAHLEISAESGKLRGDLRHRCQAARTAQQGTPSGREAAGLQPQSAQAQ